MSVRRVVILGGHVTALGIVRALAGHAAFIEVWDRTPRSVAARSRHVTAFRRLDIHDPSAVLEALGDGSGGPASVFPSEDLTAALVSRHAREIAAAGHTPVAAEWAAMGAFFDKTSTHALAESLGIGYPATADPLTAGLDGLRYPIILKPNVMQHFHQRHHIKAVECADRASALRAMETYSCPDSGYLLMAQELIPGPARQIVSLGGLFAGDQVIAAVPARHKRQYPADFGTATYIDTRAPLEAMAAVASSLLGAADYHGLAEVEFKIDPRDGELKLLEVNPRLFKWHGFTRALGINLPLMQIELLEGAARERPGLVSGDGAWRDVISDMAAGLAGLRSGEVSPGELAGEAGVRKIDSTFAWSDPAPFAYLAWLAPRMARGGRSAL